MSIPLQDLSFHCRWTSEARLPDYLGSTLRGAFGWALKASCCALKHQDCATCMLEQACGYARIFATERLAAAAGCGVNARPHPFVLHPGIPAGRNPQPGTAWSFACTFMGPALDYLPHIVYSVEVMGMRGIGSGTGHGLGRFALEKVRAGETVIFDRCTGRVHQERETDRLCLAGPPPTPVRAIRLGLETPLRLKQGNALQRDLPFHGLIRAALRRIAALETAYGQGEPSLDYRGLIQRAERIRTTASTLVWQELLRFSNRQQQKVSLGGLTGTVEYQGELTEFMPLLAYAGRVNLGKQTVFGLGKTTLQRLA